MLSIEELRAIDPDLNDLTDEEIKEIKASFYELGQIIFDDWLENKRAKNLSRQLGTDK